MPSPFPGMDPYLEDPLIWSGVHVNLITQIQAQLNPRLRPKYVAAAEERVYVRTEDDPARKEERIPDARITKARKRSPKRTQSGIATLAVSRPVQIVVMDEEVTEAYLDILDVATKKVVAVIEVLSPTNKVNGAAGRKSFLAKKRQVTESPAHWVEIDLLRKGSRFDSWPKVTAWDYMVYVSRFLGDRRSDVAWPIQLEQPLPAVSIPLKESDPDVQLDLQDVFNEVYDRGSYDLRIDYDTKPVTPLTEAQAAWADKLLRAKKARKRVHS